MDVVQHTGRWLNRHPTGPSFVWAHLYDPQDPCEPPEPHAQMYKDCLYNRPRLWSKRSTWQGRAVFCWRPASDSLRVSSKFTCCWVRHFFAYKDAKAAVEQMESARLLRPESVEAQLGLAEAHIDEGEFTEAVGQLRHLAKLRAGNPDLYTLLARAYRGSGKITEAQQAESLAKFLREEMKTR